MIQRRATVIMTAFVMATALFGLGTPAHAAMLTSTGGLVRVDDGAGYRPAPKVAKVKPGNRVAVGKSAIAMLHYPNGCTVTIAAGKQATVARKPTCANPAKRPWTGRSGVANPSGAPDPTYIFVGGAAIVTAVVVAGTARTSNKSQSASP